MLADYQTFGAGLVPIRLVIGRSEVEMTQRRDRRAQWVTELRRRLQEATPEQRAAARAEAEARIAEFGAGVLDSDGVSRGSDETPVYPISADWTICLVDEIEAEAAAEARDAGV